MAYLTHKLEFSVDPLSDTTPAWTDISAYLMEADWYSGKARDIDDAQAGGATFRLKNTGRRFEPDYAAGAYYPNIVPLRRFRWTLTADGVTYPQGIYYAQSWQVTYPARTTYSEVVVSCVDGYGLLALYPLPTLDVSGAETYAGVVQSDNPIAHFPLNETGGSKFSGDPGPDGAFKGGPVYLGATNPVLGEKDKAALLPAGTYGRAKADDVDVFKDAGAFTLECVATVVTTGGPPTVMAFGWNAAAASLNLQLRVDRLLFNNGTSAVLNSGTINPGDTVHLAATWDGSTATYYQNGAATGTFSYPNALLSSDANEYFYAKGGHGAAFASDDVTLSHVAFYDYALSPARVAAHSTAALSRGYAQATAGTRIATLATNPLWSTAGIPAGQLTVTPRMQHGQNALDEILETVHAETPLGLFYFDDNGNPDYQPWNYATTLAATFGEAEVQYDDLGLQYDDEIFNQSTASREDGPAETAQDTASQSAYSVRNHEESSLILSFDADASLVAQTFVDRFATPMYRIETLTLNGAAQNRRTQILTREIGDTIRVRRRGDGGTANPDIVTRILGKQKHLDAARNLSCTWSLSRGFSAVAQGWRIGQAGYSEAGQTTRAA